MLSEAHPYQLKVRDHFRQQKSVWDLFSDPTTSDLGITERIMTAIATHPDSKPVSLRTATLFFHYSQLFEDRRIHSADPTTPIPNDPIRAQALQLWLEHGADAEPAISHLIEGPRELDTLDIFSQQTFREQTRTILQKYLQEFRTEPVLLFVREFFPDLSWEGSETTTIAAMDASLPPETGLSIKNYFSQLLLDLAQLSK